MILLLIKLYLYIYFTKDPEAVHYFPEAGGGGGRCSTFSRGRGPNAYFYRNPYTYLLFSRGSVRTPYPPLDPHMCNVIITGQYLSQSGPLTIIVKLWFVRINDRWGFPNDSLILRTFDTFEKTQLLEVVVLAIQLFFLQNIHHLNAVSRTISVTG